MLCDMQTQLTSVPLNSKGQGLLVTFAKGHFVRIYWRTFSFKQPGLVALLTIILALLGYVYKRSISSYKNITLWSQCSGE